MLINPRRFATMLDNAVAFAKLGSGGRVLIITGGECLTIIGVGQFGIVTDSETTPHTQYQGEQLRVTLPVEDAVALAKESRAVPDAGKKDTMVQVTAHTDSMYGMVLKVHDAEGLVAEVASLGQDVQHFWDVYEYATSVSRIRDGSGGFVFRPDILGVLGKLKPNGDKNHVVLVPKTVGESGEFLVGSCWGFIEGNKRPAESLI